MIATDKEALICDLAECYHIYDYRALPARLLATLSAGLRENSRIKMKLAGLTVTRETYLLGAAVDALNLLVWMKTKDGAKGKHRPKSILQAFTTVQEKDPKDDVIQFRTGEQFTEAWARITAGRGINNNGK